MHKHTGHRQRLRKKFILSHGKCLENYELLELLLFSFIPRRDTKSIAKDLLDRYKTLDNLINSFHDIDKCNIDFSDAIYTAIACIAEIISRTKKEQVCDTNVMYNWRKLIDYLMSSIGKRKIECLCVLFLNKKNQIISEFVHEGTIDQVAIYSREIIKKAMGYNSISILISHNHPSGDPMPSKADICATEELIRACRAVKICFMDHIIVCQDKFFSYKDSRLI